LSAGIQQDPTFSLDVEREFAAAGRASAGFRHLMAHFVPAFIPALVIPARYCNRAFEIQFSALGTF